MAGLWRRPRLAAAAAAGALVGFACGHQIDVPPPRDSARAGSGGHAQAGGASGTGGALGGTGGTGGTGGGAAQPSGGSSGAPDTPGGAAGASDGGESGDTIPPWEDRCVGVKRIAVEGLPSCDLGDETVLDDLAVTRSAIALDDERVYYVGNPPPGVPCPDQSNCTSVLNVPKNGGEVRVHGSAQFTDQIAVDADFVYWTDIELEFAPKAGGESQRTYLAADGVAATGSAVVTVFMEPQPWSLLRLTTPLTNSPLTDKVTPLPELWFYPETIVTDGEWAYLVQQASSPAAPVYAVRLSDGKRRVVTSADVARGIAVGGKVLYVSEETSQSVLRVDLSDDSSTALCLAAYPTEIAADESHVYVNAEHLTDSKYSGVLVRMAADGSDACIVASGLDYESAPAVDDEFVYWAAGRLLHKLPKR